MASPQSAICADDESFGFFITLTLEGAEHAADVRRAAAVLPYLTLELAGRLEATLTSAIGFSATCWTALFGPTMPTELCPFTALADGPRHAPATPADLFIHIHSKRHDANFALARAIMAQFGQSIRLVEEIHGFRALGGRDLTGFVDGTENPKGDERPGVALVGDEDPDFIGGSYVNVQRYIHDLSRWNSLPSTAQEAVIGRTKTDDVELDDAVKPPSAHIARVVMEENGEELQIVRHSLPYGTVAESGLYFVAYGRSPTPFRRMLARMVRQDHEGHYDRLLDFTRPVTGASFFVPSIDFLQRSAE